MSYVDDNGNILFYIFIQIYCNICFWLSKPLNVEWLISFLISQNFSYGIIIGLREGESEQCSFVLYSLMSVHMYSTIFFLFHVANDVCSSIGAHIVIINRPFLICLFFAFPFWKNVQNKFQYIP